LSQQDIADIAASFQAAVVDVLVAKTMLAVEKMGVRTVMVGGGVAANSELRTALSTTCNERGITLHLAPMKYCTDNGAMVGALAGYYLKAGRTDSLAIDPRAFM